MFLHQQTLQLRVRTMDLSLLKSFLSVFLLINLFSLLKPCSCIQSEWQLAGATWYGSPNGAGSSGGACGYENAVEQPPFSSMVSSGGPSLFNLGKGCGVCYQVKCINNEACSGNPAMVVITDECPGCVSESVHFDMSGTAFGAMAVSGKSDQLRNVGLLQIQYRRVACNYPGLNVAFRVDSGANPYYFAVIIEYEDGDGDLQAVDLQDMSASPTMSSSDSSRWVSMEQSWGADWKLNSGSQLQPPFSLRLTSLRSGKTIIAKSVIPAGWQPGATYHSLINF